MRHSNTSKKQRIMSGIMSLMMLVIVLFSAFFIAAEAGHDCTGDDCPVCACIQQCERTLRGIGGGTAAQRALFVPILFVLMAVGAFAAAARRDTPVSQKVRLNN